MMSLYDQNAATETLARIEVLRLDSERQWGKMDAAQMLAHCSSFQDIALGRSFPKRHPLGFFIGRFVKSLFYNDKPLERNLPTDKSIFISTDKDFETEKEKLKQQIISFHEGGEEKCTRHPHPFFGKLSPEQWGIGCYKHLDHHLNQFGV